MKKNKKLEDWATTAKGWVSHTANVAPWALALLLGGVLWTQRFGTDPKMVHRASASFAAGDLPQQPKCPAPLKAHQKVARRK